MSSCSAPPGDAQKPPPTGRPQLARSDPPCPCFEVLPAADEAAIVAPCSRRLNVSDLEQKAWISRDLFTVHILVHSCGKVGERLCRRLGETAWTPPRRLWKTAVEEPRLY